MPREGGFHKHNCANCGTEVEHDNPWCIDDSYECDRCWEEWLEPKRNVDKLLRRAS